MNIKAQDPDFYGRKNAALLSVIYLIATGMVFYGFTVIFPAMIESLGWARDRASLAQSINALFWGLLTPLTAILINKFGSKKTITAGLVVLIAGLILLGTVTAKLWQWTLLWGVVVAAGVTMAGPLPIQTVVMYWFNIRRATVLGLVMTGAAMGGFLAQPVFTWLIGLSGSWRTGWLTAALFTVIALVISFFVRNSPGEMGQYPDGLSPVGTDTAAGIRNDKANTFRAPTSWTWKEAVKTRTLYLMMAFMITYSMPLMMVMTHGVLHFTDEGYSRMQAASVMSLILLGSGLIRLPVGWLADRVEPRWIIFAALVIMFAAVFGLWKAPALTVLMILGPAFGLAYGACLVLTPLIIGNYFSPESFPIIYGFMVPFLIMFEAAVPVAAGFNAEKSGNYDLSFAVLLVFIAMGAICAALCAPPRKLGLETA